MYQRLNPHLFATCQSLQYFTTHSARSRLEQRVSVPAPSSTRSWCRVDRKGDEIIACDCTKLMSVARRVSAVGTNSKASQVSANASSPLLL